MSREAYIHVPPCAPMDGYKRPSLATRIFDLAERVDRNVQRNDETFHVEKSEIVRELKEIAMEVRG